MPNINKANRQVCDLDIRTLKTMAPFLFFENAKTTTFGFTSEETYATAKGSKKISFSNPMEATMSVEAQVKPFKLYALLSSGTIENSAVVAEKKTILCGTSGKLTIPADAKNVFVYAENDFGGTAIEGTIADAAFTATSADLVAEGKAYEVGYLVTKSEGIQKITLNNELSPKDYYITMKTIEKDEEGVMTPYAITAYKCKPKKNLDLSFSSDGDPATVKIEFSCMEDNSGNVADMVEWTSQEV